MAVLSRHGLYRQKTRATAEERAEIVRQYKIRSGGRWTTAADLAERFNRSGNTIGKIVGDAGVKRPPSAHQATRTRPTPAFDQPAACVERGCPFGCAAVCARTQTRRSTR